MKILMVGVFNDRSTNNGIANGFDKIDGVEVYAYDYRQNIGTIDRDCRKWTDYDLIFFCKCNQVSIEVVKEAKKHAKTFLWYMDPLNGNYDDELIKKIKRCDYVGVAKWEVYEKAKELNDNTHFLIEGFDPAWDYPIECEKIYDVSFIGNPYGDRKKWLDAIPNVTILTDKFNVEHSQAVSQSKINLNFTGGGGPSDRVYKILAAGGFLLSEKWPDVERYGLRPWNDYVPFETPKELVKFCDNYLKRNDIREKITSLGYERVQKFSRDNLAKQIVEIVS